METILIKQSNGILTLERNSNPVICPFMTPTPTNHLGHMQMAFNPCSSNCVHFNHREIELPDGKENEVALTCGSRAARFIRMEVKEEPKSTILRS